MELFLLICDGLHLLRLNGVAHKHRLGLEPASLFFFNRGESKGAGCRTGTNDLVSLVPTIRCQQGNRHLLGVSVLVEALRHGEEVIWSQGGHRAAADPLVRPEEYRLTITLYRVGGRLEHVGDGLLDWGL